MNIGSKISDTLDTAPYYMWSRVIKDRGRIIIMTQLLDRQVLRVWRLREKLVDM